MITIRSPFKTLVSLTIQVVPYWEKRIELHQEVVELSKNVQLVESSKIFLKKAEKILESIS
ncbi:hypothetical protein ACVYBL_01265 [Acinetobacter baumannii]|uniref:hypothetical protein n=1 Tax=Acinetobacter baumannii TaxID=470 RepID=UPI003A872B0B